MRNHEGSEDTLSSYSVIRYPYLSWSQVIRRDPMPITELAAIPVAFATEPTPPPRERAPVAETELGPILQQMNVASALHAA